MNQTRKYLCRLMSAALLLAVLCACAAPLSAFADTVPVTGINAPSALSLTVGQTGRLNTSVIPADATDTALIFPRPTRLCSRSRPTEATRQKRQDRRPSR